MHVSAIASSKVMIGRENQKFIDLKRASILKGLSY